MTLKHIKFHQSPVMRELERIAVKKGHFDPTPEEVVDAATLDKKPNLVPSDNVYNDIMRLAVALRANGFIAQAESLENNAVIFKNAEVHLYRVHDEDGDDLLEYAHPEGEGDIAPAESDNGKVETTLTQHKRIMDVVRSEPTGKFASIAADIVKEAQLTGPEETRDSNQKKLNGIFSGLKYALRQSREWVQKNFPTQAAEISRKIDSVADGLGVTLGLDDEKYKEAAKQIKNSVSKLRDALDDLKKPSDAVGIIAYAQIGGQVSNYEFLTRQFNQQVVKMFPGLQGREVSALDRPVNEKKLRTALGYYNWSLKAWAYALQRYQDVGDSDGAAKSAKNVETIRRVVSAIEAVIKAGNTMLVLQEALQKDVPVMNEDGVVQNAYETQRSTQGMLAGILPKESSAKNGLVKLEQLKLEQPLSAPPPPPPPPPGAPSKAGPAAPKTPVKPAPTPGAGMVRKPSLPGRPTEKERQNVSVMQRLMSELALGLDKQAEKLAEVLGKTDATMNVGNIKNFARVISDTGIGTQTPFDGVWGQRTKKGLDAVNVFAHRVGVGAVDVGTGAVPYKQMSADETATKATKNAQVISQIMVKLNLSQYQKTDVPGVTKAVQGPLDVVPQTLTNTTILDRKGTIPLYEANLTSLQDFFTYLTGQGFSVNMAPPKAASKENKLEKIALEIMGQQASWVWPSAPSQTPHVRPAGEMKPAPSPTPERVGGGAVSRADVYSMTVSQFDGALRWFLQRAYQLARMAATPQQGKPVDPKVYERAMNYRQALDQLYREWWMLAQKRSLKPSDSVNLFSLNEWLGPMISRPGPSRQPAGRLTTPGQYGEGVDVGGLDGGYGRTGLEAIAEPPFTDAKGNPRRYIDLDYLVSHYRAGNMKRYFARTMLDKQILSGTPESFAEIYANDVTRRAFGRPTNPLSYRIWVARSADYILRQLSVVFENWRKEVSRVARPTRDKRIESLIADNNDELQDWAARLLGIAQEAVGQR